jgi:hypothetical protein
MSRMIRSLIRNWSSSSLPRSRQRFVGNHPPRQQAGDDRCGKKGDADDPGTHEVRRVGFQSQCTPAFLEQHRHRSQRCIKQGHASLPHQRSAGDHHQEQHGDAALLAATGEHHQGQSGDVDRHLGRKLKIEAARPAQQYDQKPTASRR